MRSVDALFWIEKLLFYAIRYPAYSDDYIKEEVESQATQIPQHELATFSQFSTSKRNFILELVAIHAIVCLKNFYFVYYTITSVDFVNTEANIKLLDGGDIGYTCLAADCPKYIESKGRATISLVSGLIELPVFAICKQEFSSYFYPSLGAQKITLIMVSGYLSLTFALCIMVPIYARSLPPLSNVTALFCICPRAEIIRIRHKIDIILKNLSFSLRNFTMNRALEQNVRKTSSRLTSRFAIRPTNFLAERSFIKQGARNDAVRVVLDSDLSKIKDNDRSHNFLPINRTQWWRHKWAHLMIIICPIVFAGCWLFHTILYLSCVYYAQYVSLEQQMDFLSLLQEANCSLWFDTNHSNINISTTGRPLNATREILNQKHLEGGWNWLAILELILSPVVPTFIISVAVSNYHCICTDIKVCIVELEILLTIAIDFIKLGCDKTTKTSKNYRAGNGNQRGPDSEQKQSSFSVFTDGQMFYGRETKSSSRVLIKSTVDTELTKRMTKIINFDLPFLFVRPVDRFGESANGKLEARLINQEFALDLMKLASDENQETADLLVGLMEKIHVNYGILMELLNEQSPALENILLISCFCNYGFSIIGVYCYRNIAQSNQSPLIFIFSLWITAVFLILITSSIHADFKKLYHLYWSIIARATDCRDLRVQHFRFIWHKNLISMGADGGLAVKIWNISITYVRILQLTLGTATIFALSLKKD